MIDDILFYSAAYISLFVSVFWLLIFMENRKKKGTLPARHLPSLSLIIPAYNEGGHLERCVASLLKQEYPGLRLIIVDDGSTDNTPEIGRRLAQKFGSVMYVRKRNRGKGAALNTGLSHVKTEYFGFIDADTFLSEHALQNMVSYFGTGAAAVIAVIKPAEPRTLVERMQKVEYMIASFTRKLMSFLNSLYYTPGFALYRTDVIRNLGGFDEDNLTEDLEIGLRLKNSGYRIENTLDDCAHTVVPRTLRDLFSQRMRWYRGYIHNSRKYSHMFFSKKHGDLGMFILPVQYLLLAVTIPMLLIGIYDLASYATKNVIDAALVGYDFAYFFETTQFNFITPFTFFIAAMLAAFLLILTVSRREVREKISPLEYLVYIIAYPFINLLLWIAAFTHEMLGTKRKW
ncbi:MAG: glycosyltransferase family 2 protein [Candidatus Aenigmarchaeota archaeon]|nr:glycosyltransferase family 2 protein [Candidatus Aenigmarchaeota archaeon]